MASGRRRCLFKQVSIIFLINPITAACHLLETDTVEYAQFSAFIFDDTELPEMIGRIGDSYAPNTEQFTQRFVRDIKMIETDTVLVSKQPSSQALFYVMETQAGGQRGELIDCCQSVQIERAFERRASDQMSHENLGRETPSPAAVLNDSTHTRTFMAQNHMSSYHAF